MYFIVYCCSDDCDGPGLCCSFYRMALGNHGIRSTEDEGKKDSNISAVNLITEDYNYTTHSRNQTAFMGDQQPKGKKNMDPNFNSRSSDSCHWSSHHRRHEEKMVPWKDNGIDKGTHIFTYQHVCLYFRVLTIAEMKEWNSY